MPDDDLVTLDQRGGVAVVTLNDPARRNAFSGPLVHALAAAMDRAERDEATRCVVVTGAGSAFCAGAEVATLRGAANGEWDDVETVYQGFLRVRDCPLPTIAAVNGPAVGAGFNLALACDVRLAGPGALFDTRFTTLRLHPGGGHAWMLARAVGQQQATLACLFGETWDARAAVQAAWPPRWSRTACSTPPLHSASAWPTRRRCTCSGWSPRCGVPCPPRYTRTRWRRRPRRSAGRRAARPSVRVSGPSRTASDGAASQAADPPKPGSRPPLASPGGARRRAPGVYGLPRVSV